MSKAKNWCFTLNNYDATDLALLLVLLEYVFYFCYGREVGESGTPHLQGYVAFEKRRTLATVKRLLRRAHWECARGISQQNKTYCEKDCDAGNPLFELGQLPSGQGRRADLDEIKELLDDGASELDIAEQYFGKWCQYRRSFQAYIVFKNFLVRRLDLRVICLEGPTGVGKM